MAAIAADKPEPRRNRRRLRARRALGARPSAGHGHSQRHAGFLFRRRPIPRSRRRPSRMPAAWPRKAPTSSTSARNRRGPMAAPSRSPPTTNWRGSTPVLPAVVELGLPVSIDTIKAAVAAWALDQGAAIVNDVWGLQRDPDMAPLVAAARRAGRSSCTTATRPMPRIDIVADVDAFFARSLDIAARPASRASRSCSIPASASARRRSRASICIARLAEFKRFGLPLLVGASRKRFINTVSPSQPDDRIGGSIAAHLLAVAERRRDHARARRAPKPCRRCASPPRSRPRDERPHLHQRAWRCTPITA